MDVEFKWIPTVAGDSHATRMYELLANGDEDDDVTPVCMKQQYRVKKPVVGESYLTWSNWKDVPVNV